MSSMTCSCGVTLWMDEPDVIQMHSEECPDAVKIGPPFEGEEREWKIKTEDGFVIGLYAVYVEEFQTPKDGLYLKIWDAGKSHPRELKKGEIVRVGVERLQAITGCEQKILNEEWLGEPVKG